MYHEAKTKGMGLKNPYSLYDGLICALANVQLFAEAETILCFVLEKRPELINSHFFIAPLTQMAFDTANDQSDRQRRFVQIFERAMASAETNPGSNLVMFDARLAQPVLYAYARLKDISGITKTMDRCQRHDIVLYRSVHRSTHTDGHSDYFAKLLSVCTENSTPSNLGRRIYGLARRSAGAKGLPLTTVCAYVQFLMQSNR